MWWWRPLPGPEDPPAQSSPADQALVERKHAHSAKTLRDDDPAHATGVTDAEQKLIDSISIHQTERDIHETALVVLNERLAALRKVPKADPTEAEMRLTMMEQYAVENDLKLPFDDDALADFNTKSDADLLGLFTRGLAKEVRSEINWAKIDVDDEKARKAYASRKGLPDTATWAEINKHSTLESRAPVLGRGQSVD